MTFCGMIVGIILCSHEEDPTGSKFLIQNVVEKKQLKLSSLCLAKTIITRYVKIPWSKFFLGSRGRIQDKQSLVPLEAGVVGMSISLMDGNTGPFHFEIKDIGLHNDPTNDDEQFAYEMYKLPDFWAGY